jgi:hypothetical protein
VSEPDDLVGNPDQLLSVEGLNYLTTALLYVTAKRMGPEFLGEVIALAEHMRGEREVAIGYQDR